MSTIFLSAGEPSGDQHAAALASALRCRFPGLTILGFGGPRMAAAGCHLLADLTAHAVMGFSRPLTQLHRFYRYYRQAVEVFDREPPAAVILVDYPGFHWHLAKAAKTRGIPVFYYGLPQIWAWARWRVKKVRRWIDHVFCWLPFEKKWLEDRGCSATYVGHPFFDESAAHSADEVFLRQLTHDGGPLLTLLPGSRDQEVEANGRMMLDAALLLIRRVPGLRVAVAAFREHHAQHMHRWAGERRLPVLAVAGKTPELIRAATCCLAVSGSVSLELLYHEKPSVIVYRIGPVAARLETYVRRVKYITLVNLLYYGGENAAEVPPADHMTPAPRDALFPEFLTCRDESTEIAERLALWFMNPAVRADTVERLRALKASLGWHGAVERAAEAIADRLQVGRPGQVLGKAA